MVSDRIEALITHFCKGNKSLFAKQIGVTPSVIGNITGERKGNPSFEVAQKILDAFVMINPDWLMLGRGSMLRSDQSQPTPQPAVQPAVHQDSSPGEATVYYKMYKEEKAEKESKIEEIGALKLKISQLESNKLANPKAKVDTQSKEPKASREVEPKAPDHPPLAFDGGFIESFTSESSGGSAKDSIPMRSPTTSSKKSSAAKT